jgi:transposase
MVVADGKGIPLGVLITFASPAEVTLAEATLATISVPRKGPGRPKSIMKRLIGDKAYDADRLRTKLRQRGIELICPHRRNRKRASLQDGRALRRYRRRWKIERTISWFGAFERLVVRYERSHKLFLAFFHIAAAIITLRWL